MSYPDLKQGNISLCPFALSSTRRNRLVSYTNFSITISVKFHLTD